MSGEPGAAALAALPPAAWLRALQACLNTEVASTLGRTKVTSALLSLFETPNDDCVLAYLRSSPLADEIRRAQEDAVAYHDPEMESATLKAYKRILECGPNLVGDKDAVSKDVRKLAWFCSVGSALATTALSDAARASRVADDVLRLLASASLVSSSIAREIQYKYDFTKLNLKSVDALSDLLGASLLVGDLPARRFALEGPLPDLTLLPENQSELLVRGLTACVNSEDAVWLWRFMSQKRTMTYLLASRYHGEAKRAILVSLIRRRRFNDNALVRLLETMDPLHSLQHEEEEEVLRLLLDRLTPKMFFTSSAAPNSADLEIRDQPSSQWMWAVGLTCRALSSKREDLSDSEMYPLVVSRNTYGRGLAHGNPLTRMFVMDLMTHVLARAARLMERAASPEDRRRLASRMTKIVPDATIVVGVRASSGATRGGLALYARSLRLLELYAHVVQTSSTSSSFDPLKFVPRVVHAEETCAEWHPLIAYRLARTVLAHRPTPEHYLRTLAATDATNASGMHGKGMTALGGLVLLAARVRARDEDAYDALRIVACRALESFGQQCVRPCKVSDPSSVGIVSSERAFCSAHAKSVVDRASFSVEDALRFEREFLAWHKEQQRGSGAVAAGMLPIKSLSAAELASLPQSESLLPDLMRCSDLSLEDRVKRMLACLEEPARPSVMVLLALHALLHQRPLLSDVASWSRSPGFDVFLTRVVHLCADAATETSEDASLLALEASCFRHLRLILREYEAALLRSEQDDAFGDTLTRFNALIPSEERLKLLGKQPKKLAARWFPTAQATRAFLLLRNGCTDLWFHPDAPHESLLCATDDDDSTDAVVRQALEGLVTVPLIVALNVLTRIQWLTKEKSKTLTWLSSSCPTVSALDLARLAPARPSLENPSGAATTSMVERCRSIDSMIRKFVYSPVAARELAAVVRSGSCAQVKLYMDLLRVSIKHPEDEELWASVLVMSETCEKFNASATLETLSSWPKLAQWLGPADSGNPDRVKCGILRLVTKCVSKSPEGFLETRRDEWLPMLLRGYKASLSRSDLELRRLFQVLGEENGPSALGFAFGAAVSQEGLQKRIAASTLSCLIGEGYAWFWDGSVIDAERLRASCQNLASAEPAPEDSQAYDPSYLLPAINHVLGLYALSHRDIPREEERQEFAEEEEEPQGEYYEEEVEEAEAGEETGASSAPKPEAVVTEVSFPARRFAQNGMLAFCVSCLASPEDEVRARARTALRRYGQLVLRCEGFRERNQVGLILRALRDSIRPDKPMAPLFCAFVSEFFYVVAARGASHPMWERVTKFALLHNGRFDALDVPMFYETFNSGEPDFEAHRLFSLRVMERGIQAKLDLKLLQRRNVLDVLISTIDSPLGDPAARKLGLWVLQRVGAVSPSVLINAGVVTWAVGLLDAMTLETATGEGFRFWGDEREDPSQLASYVEALLSIVFTCASDLSSEQLGCIVLPRLLEWSAARGTTSEVSVQRLSLEMWRSVASRASLTLDQLSRLIRAYEDVPAYREHLRETVSNLHEIRESNATETQSLESWRRVWRFASMQRAETWLARFPSSRLAFPSERLYEAWDQGKDLASTNRCAALVLQTRLTASSDPAKSSSVVAERFSRFVVPHLVQRNSLVHETLLALGLSEALWRLETKELAAFETALRSVEDEGERRELTNLLKGEEDEQKESSSSRKKKTSETESSSSKKRVKLS